MNELIITVIIIIFILNIIIIVKFFGLCSNANALKTKLCDHCYFNPNTLTNEYKGIKVGDKVIRKRDNKEIEIIKIYEIADYHYVGRNIIYYNGVACYDNTSIEIYNIEEFKL